MTAETWLQVVRGLAGFRGDEQAWRAWLFTTARRRPIDEARRREKALEEAQPGQWPTSPPALVQRFAHDIIGAPSPRTRPAIRPSSRGAPGAGDRAHGLCAAWAQAKAHGAREQRAVAFGKLEAAAGGADHVTAYCAAVARAGTSPSPRPQPVPAPHGSRKPSRLPASHGSGKPSGLPASHGSGKPSGLPTSQGSGGPTVHPTGKPPGQP